jgi:formylglycine-generating enzyme required for sulfatase activity
VALREWKNDNHDSGALLRGVPLTVAEDWLHKRAPEMTQEEQDFIQVSIQQRHREKEEREYQRQRELALERQARYRLQWLVAVLTAIVFSTTSYLAYPKLLRWQAAALGKMIKISSSEFIVGTNDLDAEPEETPQRRTYLPEFEIEKYEVSNRQYRLCVKARVCSLL